MRRWHSERGLMLRRWRMEIAKHELVVGAPRMSLAPLPPVGDGGCHCYRGPGFMRKRTPYGCGNPRCGICHYEKNFEPKRRGAMKRAAIDFELRAIASSLDSSLTS